MPQRWPIASWIRTACSSLAFGRSQISAEPLDRPQHPVREAADHRVAGLLAALQRLAGQAAGVWRPLSDWPRSRAGRERSRAPSGRPPASHQLAATPSRSRRPAPRARGAGARARARAARRPALDRRRLPPLPVGRPRTPRGHGVVARRLPRPAERPQGERTGRARRGSRTRSFSRRPNPSRYGPAPSSTPTGPTPCAAPAAVGLGAGAEVERRLDVRPLEIEHVEQIDVPAGRPPRVLPTRDDLDVPRRVPRAEIDVLPASASARAEEPHRLEQPVPAPASPRPIVTIDFDETVDQIDDPVPLHTVARAHGFRRIDPKLPAKTLSLRQRIRSSSTSSS